MTIVSDLLFGVKIAISIGCICGVSIAQMYLYESAKKDKNIITYGMLVASFLLEAYVILSILEKYGY